MFLSSTPWTVPCQASPPMGFSGQEYWSGLPFPSPEDLPDPGIKPGSPALQFLYHLNHQGRPMWIYMSLIIWGNAFFSDHFHVFGIFFSKLR